MKKLILLMLVITLTLPTMAQKNNNLFEQLTDEYAEKDGFSASRISSDMFDLYLKKRNIDEDSPVFDALKKLDNILIVSQSNVTRGYRSGGYYNLSSDNKDNKTDSETELNKIHSAINSHYKNNNYSLFKTENRMGEDVKVYIKKNQNKIESLALLTKSSVSTNLVELQGDIDLKTVSELNKALNLRGLENLYKIDNSSSGIYGYSVGKSVYNKEKLEEMIARQQEMVAKQHELTDEQRAQFEKQAKQMAEKQLQMVEKYREMAEKYQRNPIFLSYPGDTNMVYFLNGKIVKSKQIKEINKDKIESISVTKADKEGDKTTIRIKTK